MGSFSGTSAAAPQLAGICALVKQMSPNLSPAQIREVLKDTARDVASGNSNPSTGGHEAVPGVDLATGHGLVDAYETVKKHVHNNTVLEILEPDVLTNVQAL